MASNYDMRKLILGPAIAAVACVLATTALVWTGTSDAQSLLVFGAITLAYGIMMFASSYVEEEQHFWYWTTTAWMASLVVKYRTRSVAPNLCAFILELTPPSFSLLLLSPSPRQLPDTIASPHSS